MSEDYEHFEVLQLGHFQAKREFRRSYNPPWIFEVHRHVRMETLIVEMLGIPLQLGVSGRLGGFLNISCVWFVLVIVLNFRERIVSHSHKRRVIKMKGILLTQLELAHQEMLSTYREAFCHSRGTFSCLVLKDSSV
ncbi:hypothetical protein P8452_39583 [Trifolium repens]|nr:hypothetical protein P8452_39583 [Trifolium repens]